MGTLCIPANKREKEKGSHTPWRSPIPKRSRPLLATLKIGRWLQFALLWPGFRKYAPPTLLPATRIEGRWIPSWTPGQCHRGRSARRTFNRFVVARSRTPENEGLGRTTWPLLHTSSSNSIIGEAELNYYIEIFNFALIVTIYNPHNSSINLVILLFHIQWLAKVFGHPLKQYYSFKIGPNGFSLFRN